MNNNKVNVLRKYLIQLLLILSVTIVKAQELKVIEFRADLTLTEALKHPKNDLNGDRCGLILLGLVMPDAVFEGNIISSEYHNGEWRIYMAKDANWLNIKTNDFVPLRYEFEGIQSNVTYVMTVVKKPTDPEQNEIKEQYLIFQIDPHSALLEVNNQPWTVSADGTSTKFVKFDTYSYRVQAKDYYTETGTVTVSNPNNPQKVTVTLQPHFGWIEVAGTGSLQDASVYVDNTFIGKAPCKSNAIGSGEHVVSIAKDMYEAYSNTVTVTDNQTTKVSPELKTDFAVITLQVDSNAEIWVNNQKKGNRSWTGPLGSGTYMIECKQAGHETSKTTREITADMDGQTIILPIPRPSYGLLNVESTPFAKIYIDGKAMGETPKSIPEILIGEHELKLKKDGYEDHVEMVSIKKGERAQVKVTLKASTSANNGQTTPLPNTNKPVNKKPEKEVTKAFFIMANASYSIAPQTAFGLTVGSMKKHGWYISFGSNFQFKQPTYECNGSGVIIATTGSNSYTYSDQKHTSRISATAGTTLKIANPISAYLGIGYGWRNLYWELDNGDRVKNIDYSHKGITFDGGVLLHFNSVGLSFGAQTISFKYLEAKIGIGYTIK